jgi:hypothetical protein
MRIYEPKTPELGELKTKKRVLVRRFAPIVSLILVLIKLMLIILI